MSGQQTQHTSFVETVQTQDTEGLWADFLPYPGFWHRSRKSLLSLLSLLSICFKPLVINMKYYSTDSTDFQQTLAGSQQTRFSVNTYIPGKLKWVFLMSRLETIS